MKTKDRQFNKIRLKSLGLLVVNALVTALLFAGVRGPWENPGLFTGISLFQCLLVLYTDYYLLRSLIRLRQRRQARSYLAFSLLLALLFQVNYDILLDAPPSFFLRILYDLMYNISFCMLFVVAFALADFVLETFWQQLED